ncbi:MAG: hypothetical protein HYZ12_04610 [Thaumarchaeota archaeon]|nr:hypothetical protein [Nitrososphaerota archaeon]
MNWLMWIAALLSIGAPSAVLMLSLGRDFFAPKLIRRLGPPALILFIAVFVYSSFTNYPLVSLLIWGTIGGLLGGVTLDAVRLIGVKLRAFPLDMPVMFGLMSLGVTPNLPKTVIARMVEAVSEMPDEKRKEMMEPRIKAMTELSPSERKLFMSMMTEGLNKLPEEKREKMFKTQIEIISSLPEEKRVEMMRTMDEVMLGLKGDQVATSGPSSPMPIFRAGRMPKLPMSTARALLRKAIPDALKEHNTTLGKARLAGYTWHFVNGATYGMAFTLLFGMGSWPLALAWGLLVDLVMMVSMPPMMPMMRLPFPRFLVFPYFAHLAMAVPIGYFAVTYITPEATRNASLLGPLLLAGDAYVMLTLLPIIAFVGLSAIILLGYKAYTKPIYGKGWQ